MSTYCTVTECFYLSPCPVHNVAPPPAYDADTSLEISNVPVVIEQPFGPAPPYQANLERSITPFVQEPKKTYCYGHTDICCRKKSSKKRTHLRKKSKTQTRHGHD